MKTNGKKKGFDAVKMMREIRDKMDREIANMTFAEEKAYIAKLLTQDRQRSSRKPEAAPR